MIPERIDSWMFHHPGLEWTRLQAEATGIPQVTAKVSGVKEEELGPMKEALYRLVKTYGIKGVVTGAIASEYQKSRVDRICDELGLRSLAPLWGMNPEHLLTEQIEMGFEFIMTACMAMGLDSSWLGREVDGEAIDDLKGISRKYGISLVFEGGEAETYVIDAPIFRKRIRITEARSMWKGDSGYLDIVKADLQEKPA
jgi:ABC transporter with metal-binding/Fe-S-binding domain ATP-binding protein